MCVFIQCKRLYSMYVYLFTHTNSQREYFVKLYVSVYVCIELSALSRCVSVQTALAVSVSLFNSAACEGSSGLSPLCQSAGDTRRQNIEPDLHLKWLDPAWSE